jgi:hypothetical protein
MKREQDEGWRTNSARMSEGNFRKRGEISSRLAPGTFWGEGGRGTAFGRLTGGRDCQRGIFRDWIGKKWDIWRFWDI